MSVFLGLGSNLGDRPGFLSSAIRLLDEAGVRIASRSSLYETAPVGIQSRHDFVNMVVRVETKLGPWSLLDACLRIENVLGRSREKQDRPIDIDLLYYGQLRLSFRGLDVPHPRLAERRFVLVPLAEVAPTFIDPRSGLTVQQLLDACRDRSRVSLIRETPFP